MAPHILSISSQVSHGPVGNSAAVPGMAALGLTVHPVPTVTLSNHPGLGPPAGFRTEARHLGSILGALGDLGVLQKCGAILTGYFASSDQVFSVAHTIRRMKQDNSAVIYLCDPVLGDDPDGLYVPLPVAEAIREELVPLADMLSPNRFELSWLTQQPVGTAKDAVKVARSLPATEVLATSIPDGDSRLATFAITRDAAHQTSRERLSAVPHGTGDLLAGLYLAHRARGEPPASALHGSMVSLDAVIRASAGSTVLDLVNGLR